MQLDLGRKFIVFQALFHISEPYFNLFLSSTRKILTTVFT